MTLATASGSQRVRFIPQGGTNVQTPKLFWQMAAPAVGLRPERGYLETNYGANPASPQKTLRCQLGRFYDFKKVRNSYAGPTHSYNFTMIDSAIFDELLYSDPFMTFK